MARDRQQTRLCLQECCLALIYWLRSGHKTGDTDYRVLMPFVCTALVFHTLHRGITWGKQIQCKWDWLALASSLQQKQHLPLLYTLKFWIYGCCLWQGHRDWRDWDRPSICRQLPACGRPTWTVTADWSPGLTHIALLHSLWEVRVMSLRFKSIWSLYPNSLLLW